MSKNDMVRREIYPLLDDDYEISTDVIFNKGWKTLPLIDTLNPMEAEWISNAVKTLFNIKQLVAINIEYQKSPEFTVIINSRDSILNFVALSTGYVIITDNNNNFLYYKDQANRFGLLCGSQSYIEKAFPCSYDTARIMYFSYWEDDLIYTEQERLEFKKFWFKYNQNIKEQF